VQPFDRPGPRTQVTTNGGVRLAWAAGGRQLTFGTVPDGYAQRTADVLPGPEFRLGPSRIYVRVPPTIETGDATRDGRLAVQVPAGKAPQIGITVVLDWPSGLARR